MSGSKEAHHGGGSEKKILNRRLARWSLLAAAGGVAIFVAPVGAVIYAGVAAEGAAGFGIVKNIYDRRKAKKGKAKH